MLFALCSSAEAQQATKVFRIGYLDPSTASGSAVLLAAFRQELRKLGWIEGKDFTIEYRFGENKPGPGRLRELAADLVRLKVDLIVASGARSATSGEDSNEYHPHRDDEHWGSCESRSGCQSGASGRQYHREREFIARVKYQKARDTQGRSSPSSPELDICSPGRDAVYCQTSNLTSSGLRLWH